MSLAQKFRQWLPHNSERAVYEAIVAAARRPKPYAEWGVPDTLDGRFEMIAIHAILVLRALAGDRRDPVQRFRQALTDEIFRDMDRSLREMGTGDLSVGKKVRKMAEVFFGRLKAYSEALDQPEPALEEALRRNVWPEGEGRPAKLANHVRMLDNALKQQDAAAIVGGKITFPDPA
jgi:cytochrome b pre-mRNA-processing protein 3